MDLKGHKSCEEREIISSTDDYTILINPTKSHPFTIILKHK